VPDVKLNGNRKHLITTALVLTFLPSQPRRKLSLSGGSAAKVSEAPLTKLNQLYKSGASSLPPTRQARFSGIRGCRGRLLLVTFLGETRKVTSRRATPGQRISVLQTPLLQQPALRQAQGERAEDERLNKLSMNGGEMTPDP